MKPLKVKILGSGNAAQKHARAFAELPELYLITDSDDHDIVDICTPNYAHCGQAWDALIKGKHCLVEKPICGSLLDLDNLAEMEKMSGSFVIPIFQYRFHGHGAVKDLIAMRWQRPSSYFAGWKGDPELAFGGCLTSHGIHAIDLMIRRFGMPRKIFAHLSWMGRVENIANLSMIYENVERHISVVVSPSVEQGGFNLGNQHLSFIQQFELTHEALTSGGPLPVTLAQARQSIEVLTAAYYSAYTGEPVMLPIEPGHPFFGGWSQAFKERSDARRK